MSERLYCKTHEWIVVEDDPEGGKIGTVGISAFAVAQLTDLVFIDLPSIGKPVEAGKPFGEVESVKAVSDLYSPVNGEVVAVNDTLPDHLEKLSDDPLGEGWIAKIKLTDGASLDHLLDQSAYDRQCAEEAE